VFGNADLEPQNLGVGLVWSWSPTSRTRNRHIEVVMNGKRDVDVVRIWPLPNESLDVREVIKRADLFTFDSGIFTSSAYTRFTATMKDGTVELQFIVYPNHEPELESVLLHPRHIEK
jgi:DUF971 family protein